MQTEKKKLTYNKLVKTINTKVGNDNLISLEDLTKTFHDLQLETVLKETNLCKNVELDEQKCKHIQFYKDLLQKVDEAVNSRLGKIALKDNVGRGCEDFRKQIWEYFGFTVVRICYDATYKVDLAIYKDGILIAIEECKGHYVDKDFLHR